MTQIKDPAQRLPDQTQIDELHQSLFQIMPRALLFLDARFRVLDCNTEFISQYYFFNQELKGKFAQSLFNAPINQLITSHLGKGPTVETFSFESIIYDGLFLPRSVTCIVTVTQGAYLLELIDDTERLRNERAAQAIGAVQIAMLKAVSEEDLMHAVVNRMIDLGHYRFAWIGLLQNDDKKTMIPVAYAGFEDGYLANIDINLTDPQRYRGPTGQALIMNKPSICRNTELDPNFAPWRDNALKRGYHSSIALPLSYLDNPPIGAIMLYSGEVNAFDQREVELLINMATVLTFGINMRRAEHGLKQTAQELQINLKKMKRIITQTVDALATSVDIRDPYTAGHQRRVTKLAVAIADEMGLKGEALHEVTVAASLHDIGQITVPTEILSRPGKLSAIEIAIIRTHAKAGYDIIKDVEFPWPIAEIVYQHHEKMDGSGYPRGLKGDEIVMSARILMVANVVEAMMSHRPYRPSLGQKAALDEIMKNKGLQYDEQVVDACLRLFEENRFEFDQENH